MLEPIMNILGSQRIVLASSSPRRQEILKNLGLKFTVVASRYEENLNPDDFPCPGEFVIATAVNKVTEVVERLDREGEKYDLVIGADTIVYKDKKVYGKPKDEDEAFRVLKSFSGEKHTVFSGVNIRGRGKNITFSESTDVYFGDISDDVIRAYVKTGDPLDKAGGYGIQVNGGTFIKKIDGDYYNVVGLPLYSLCKHIHEFYAQN
ncbi:UNVERIFIED_CONTAM: hypothetical protein PYX00_006159 [Menopon gallinae]|uniref:Nucleic acid-binding protein asmtl n=1 Tax=Menopon gallinae TaxID=328185 RepID=A0AAW2HUC0_9NEOP